MNIAVIYPKRIKQEALPYHEYECFFEKEREKMHQNFMEEEKKLREEFLKLKKQKKITKKYEAQKEIFQEKIKTLETSLQNKKEIFLQKINKITSDLQDELNRTIKNIVQEESFNIVLNAEADEKLLVLYADESLDITDQVIEKLKSFKYQF